VKRRDGWHNNCHMSRDFVWLAGGGGEVGDLQLHGQSEMRMAASSKKESRMTSAASVDSDCPSLPVLEICSTHVRGALEGTSFFISRGH
jgi:hypothetical protein